MQTFGAEIVRVSPGTVTHHLGFSFQSEKYSFYPFPRLVQVFIVSRGYYEES